MINSLCKRITLALVGAVLTAGLVGCGAPNEESKPPVMDTPHPDIAPAKPGGALDHPDLK